MGGIRQLGLGAEGNERLSKTTTKVSKCTGLHLKIRQEKSLSTLEMFRTKIWEAAYLKRKSSPINARPGRILGLEPCV